MISAPGYWNGKLSPLRVYHIPTATTAATTTAETVMSITLFSSNSWYRQRGQP